MNIKVTIIIVAVIHIIAFMGILNITGIPTEKDGVNKSIVTINGK